MPVLACKSCGAPLDLAVGTPVVTCRYCKAQNRVASPWPPPRPVVRQAAGSGGRVATMMVIFIAVLVVVAGAAAFIAQRGGVLANDASAGLWYSLGTCPVDANGDGVDDVAGINGPIGGGFALAMVDGATGDLLWRGPEVSEGTMMLQCLSERWVAVSTDDFVVRLHDPRKPDPPLTVRGRDKLQTAVMGDGCVALKAQDGSVMGVALPAGTLTECPVELPPYAAPYSRVGRVDESAEVVVGARRVTLATRQQGTPVLTLGVHEGERTLFERELPYAARNGAGLAVAGDRIVIYGHLPGKSEQGLLVGFDARTGDELYAVPLEGKVTDRFGAMLYNGRHVVLQYWTYLRAYDPATGARVW